MAEKASGSGTSKLSGLDDGSLEVLLETFRARRLFGTVIILEAFRRRTFQDRMCHRGDCQLHRRPRYLGSEGVAG